MIVFAVTAITAGAFQKGICQDIDGGVYSANACYTDSNMNVSAQSVAFNSTGKVMDSINITLGFISIVIIIAISKILIDNVRLIGNGNNDV